MPNIRKLDVWGKAHHISLRAESVARRFARRKPSLASQLERAADSVASCIAEGRGCDTDPQFARYLSMAISSTTEVENHLIRGYDGGYIPYADYSELIEGTIEVRKMLIGLRRTVRGEKRDTKRRSSA